MLNSRPLLTLITLCLVGCATNPYKTFYEPVAFPGEPNWERMFEYLKDGQEPILRTIDHTTYEETEKSLYRNGFMLIGQSNFSGAYFDKKLALSKAKEVGATYVLLYAKYNKDIKYQQKIVLPNYSSTNQYSNGNSNTYGNANVNLFSNTYNATGNNIYGNTYGNSNTYNNSSSSSYTSGYKTELVDAQYSEYDQFAGYYVKVKDEYVTFGVWPVEIPDKIRSKLQTNKGFCVGIVINQSPAYKSDILEGDIIISSNGEPIFDYITFLEENSGKRVELEIYRNNGFIKKIVTLNPKS